MFNINLKNTAVKRKMWRKTHSSGKDGFTLVKSATDTFILFE